MKEETSAGGTDSAMTSDDKIVVLSYLRRVASAARALASDNNNNPNNEADDIMDIDSTIQLSSSEDCQEYLDWIARDLLLACDLDRILQPPSSLLPRQKLLPVNLEHDMPREENTSDHKQWQRLDYLRNLLRSMAPIAMDVVAHICALILPPAPDSQQSTTSTSNSSSTSCIPNDQAVALYILVSVWLPIAPQLTPLVWDLYRLPCFPCPFDETFFESSWHLDRLAQRKVWMIVQATHALCQFVEWRGEISIVHQWWNWSPIFGLLHRTTLEDGDVAMMDINISENDDNGKSFSFLQAVRWHVARVIGYLLQVRPLARGQYFESLNVHVERVPWVVHPWILDEEEGTTQELCVQGLTKIWSDESFPLPTAAQIRTCITNHPWLVHVGQGIVFAKHNPIASSEVGESISTQPSNSTENPDLSSIYLSNSSVNSKRQSLTRTSTTAENLALLGASLCSHPHPPPVLICGPHGSGKSSLVRELALIFGSSGSISNNSHDDHLLEIHVDEETDAKTLIGSYTMTDIPGEFAWKAGALTQAVRAGKWVLIEDVDSVPIEIQAALVKLMEDRVLPLGASGKMERCHSNFRLFGTCTTTNDRSGHGRVGGGGGKRILNASLWRQVHVKPLPYEDLKEIALALHPNLPPSIIDSALAILKAVDRSGREISTSGSSMTTVEDTQQQVAMMLVMGGRHPSVRDFFKLLSRISHSIVFERNVKYATESQRTLCMAECVDIFLAACPHREKRRDFVRSMVAPTWGITADLALGYLESRQPVTQIGQDFVEIGRAKLPLLLHKTQAVSDGFTETSFSLRLMESIAVGIKENEPLLLVGETGAGKTSVVQHLSQHCGRELIVQNLSLQTDSTDLLGGYRPLELQHVAHKVYRSFVDVFVATFSRKQNAQFLEFASKALSKKDWKKLSQCFVRAAKLGLAKVKQREHKGEHKEATHIASKPSWQHFSDTAERFERQRLACDSGLVFTFTEGALVDAIRQGKWVLLDEINLASSEILQRLLGLLDDRAGSLTLTERGDAVSVPRHPDFRLFAAMNPATDAGKKELHPSFRSRFTEIYVDELLDPIELRVVSSRYLLPVLPPSDQPAEHCAVVTSSVNVYLQCRKLAEDVLVDGSGHKPRFTLRTLARAMTAAKNLVIQQRISLKRAIVEGFELAIQGPLDAESVKAVQRVLKSSLGERIPKKEKDHPGRRPGKSDSSDYVLIKPFWIQAGPLTPIDWSESSPNGRSKFILTQSAEINLRRLARAIAAGPWPVLLEGPTSAGKTTLVEYIAARVGHRVVRINNHEHTDVQEYTGSFAPDSNGSLSFQDGILVRALKRGDWVILDELNLAPSEVLEALNRLLDDNRQLYLPEINQVILPHPNFRLFATQNPSGAYGGRKPLSRAFRNRFVELNVDDIPSAEMTTILEKRCSCPTSHAEALVAVMVALRQRRSKSGVFMGKDGLITPRDLLRWAERRASSKVELAQDGYMLLAERLRTQDEKDIVKQEIERQLKVKIDLDELYFSHESAAWKELSSFTAGLSPSSPDFRLVSAIAPTKSMLRLMNLILRCIRQEEPVLLCGDTGNGKTTVVDLLSTLLRSKLRIINCHATTETSDLIGGLRPVRGRNTIALKMCDKVKSLLQKWPDSNALGNIEIPEYLHVSTMTWSHEHEETVDANMINEPVDLPDTAASDMIKLVRALQDSNRLQIGDATSESPRKKPKVESNQHTEKGNALEIDIGEIEDLFHRHSSLFEWSDGPVAAAMKNGDMLLLDELSLAEDAVLERLNSVLEPSRTLVLAEKGEDKSLDHQIDSRIIEADSGFRVFATMNPGGDFGKRELSPALRSRFTEIWVPPVDERSDIELVLSRSLSGAVADKELQSCHILEKMLAYVEWFNNSICKDPSTPYPGLILSLRDVLTWTRFITKAREVNHDLNVWNAYCHGAALMHLDGLGLGSGLSLQETSAIAARAKAFLTKQIERSDQLTVFNRPSSNLRFTSAHGLFGLHPFWVQTGQYAVVNSTFNFEAPRTAENVYRVLRAMQLSKPILLEGSPGVGKTSLVQAIANAAGHKLVRINLSEQTDMSDLMGSDLPVPETNADGKLQASFKWCDGVLLTAIKNGDWVLLDELNLASQSVLEGLNSCLDYRASVFVPELGKTFDCPPTFRVFAAQNPLAQGGGRKGLPRSFLNRFTKVYIEALTGSDLRAIVASKYSSLSTKLIGDMVSFNERVHEAVVDEHRFGHAGSPWEFNLRDVFRWADLLELNGASNDADSCAHFASFIYLQRFRNENDRQHLRSMYSEIFGVDILTCREIVFDVGPKLVRIGGALLQRLQTDQVIGCDECRKEPALLQSFLSPMEAVARCIQLRWPCLLVGKPGSGKSSIVNTLSELCNADLVQVSLSPSSDVNELVGCFEQVDIEAQDKEVLTLLDDIASKYIFEFSGTASCENNVCHLLYQLKEKCNESGMEVLLSRNPALRSIATELAIALGSITQSNGLFGEKHASTVANMIQHVQEGCLGQSIDAHFQWMDGVLARAMTEGSWLLLENVNLCPSSVLDRLNPVMETNGELLMAECGVQKDENAELGHRVIKAHPNFRVFLTMDPENGEVSRAMRNRCIEIALLSPETTVARNSKVNAEICPFGGGYVDSIDVSWRAGLRSSRIAEHVMSCYRLACKDATTIGLEPPCIKTVAASAMLAADLLGQGLPWETTMRIIQNVFSWKTLASSPGEHNEKSGQLVTCPKFRSGWLTSPNETRVEWQGRLCRLFLGNISELLPPAQLLLDNADLFHLSPCNESIAHKYEVTCAELPHELSLTASFRDSLMMLFLAGASSDHLDLVSIYLLGNEDPMVSTYNGMVELLLQCKDSLSGKTFESLSSENDWNANLRRLPQRVKENTWLKAMESRSPSQLVHGTLRILDVSFHIQNGGIDRSSVSCQVTPMLFPLMRATDHWIGSVVLSFGGLSESQKLATDMAGPIRQALEQRDRFWLFLHGNSFSPRNDTFLPFDEAQFMVQWKWFKESLRNLEQSLLASAKEFAKETKQALYSLIETIDTFIFGDARYHVSPSIWSKISHPMVPCKAIQWEAIVRLRRLASLNFDQEGSAMTLADDRAEMELADLIAARHPLLYVHKLDKMELLLAYSMLHWSSTDEIVGEMRPDVVPSFAEDASIAIQSQWQAKQQAFYERLDRIRVDPSINTVENMFDIDNLQKIEAMHSCEMGSQAYRSFSDGVLCSFGRVQLVSSAEAYCCDEETAIVRELGQAALGSSGSSELTSTLRELARRVRDFIDNVISWTNWPVSDLRPYQTLVWACESSFVQENDLTKLLDHLLPVMVSTLLKHLTTGTTASVSANLDMPVLFVFDQSDATEGGCNRPLSRDGQDVPTNDRWSHTRSLIKISCSAYVPTKKGTSGAFCTLENHHARAVQACDFAHILSTDSFQNLNPAPYEINHVAMETLVALKKWMVDEGVNISKAKLHELLCEGKAGQLQQIFAKCSHSVFQDFFHVVMVPLFGSLSRIWTSQNHKAPSRSEDLALSQTYTGLLRLHLVLPESPLDPGRKPLAKMELIRSHTDHIRVQIAAARLSSGFLNGNFSPDNPYLNELLNQGMALANKSASQSKKVVERVEDAASFAELYRECREFAKNVCSKEAVLSLLSLNQESSSPLSESYENTSNRTENWLRTADAFCERLVSHFGDYEDVILPMVDSVRLIQIGLRGLMDLCLPKKEVLHKQLETVQACLQYPIGSLFDDLTSFKATMGSIPLTRKPNVVCHRALAFAALYKILLQKLAHGLDQRSAQTSNSIFVSLVDKEVDGKDETKPLGSDDDEQERVYREQFPDHRSEFYSLLRQDEDITAWTGPSEEDAVEDESIAYSPMSSDDIEKLCFLHRALYSDETTINDGDRCWTFLQSLSAAISLSSEFGYSRLENKQTIGTSSHVMALSLLAPVNSPLSQLGTFRGSTASIDHFYNDSNPVQVLKASQALDSLLARITQLLTAFPGNELLVGVFRVADTARKLDLHKTSVGKIMAAFEIILKQAQDWEQHASTRVQIGSPLKEISGVVTMWRKLELQSWKDLLSSREERFCKRARRHWVRIYKVLHTVQSQKGMHAPATEVPGRRHEQWSPRWTWKGISKHGRRLFDVLLDTANQELFELAKVMDTFMLTSPAGEFQERLKLITAFSNQSLAESQAKVDHSRYLNLQCSRLLISLAQYYEQFRPCVFKKLETLRAPIENSLRDQMKLAKWDEQSYYALAESSEKNHRNLMKCMRDYDDALSMNVGVLLDQDLCAGIRSESSTQDEACVSMPSTSQFFPLQIKDGSRTESKLSKLPSLKDKNWNDLGDFATGESSFAGNMKRYANKMERMIKQKTLNKKSFSYLGGDIVREFCSDVFHRLDALRGKNTSRQMKERALADLFKELKRHGYSYTKWATPKEQRQMMHVFQLPSPTAACANNHSEAFVSKVEVSENYFLRFLAELTRLRSETEVIGSKYMSRRETEMMLSFSEHGLLMLMQQRCLLSSALSDVQTLQAKLSSFLIENEKVLAQQCKSKEQLLDARSKCRSAIENARQLQFLLKVAKPLLNDNDAKVAWANDTDSKLEFDLPILEALILDVPEVLTGKHLTAAQQAHEQVEKLMMTCRICQDQNAALMCLPKDAVDVCISQFEAAASALAAFSRHQDCMCIDDEGGADFRKLVGSVSLAVKTALLSVQNSQAAAIKEPIRENVEENVVNEHNGDEEVGLWACHSGTAKEWADISIKTLIGGLDDVLIDMKKMTNFDLVTGMLSDLGVFCKLACCIFEEKLLDFLQFVRDSAKFHYVLIRVFRVLVSKGYCSDETASDDGGEGDATGMNFEENDGTGMGEGDGKQDVTDQLESEEQLLGLESDKNEGDEGNKEQQQLDEKEAEQGMEMEGKFEGDMFDLPDNPAQNEDDEEEDEEELDREMGLEEDPNEQVVDEKMWNDSDDEDDTQEGQEKFEKDTKMTGDQDNDQVRTREDEEQPNGDADKDDAKEQSAQSANDKEENEKNEKEDGNGNESDHDVNDDLEDNYEEGHGVDVRQEEIVEEQADESMELDNDLHLEDDDAGDEGGDEPAEEENSPDDSEGNEVPGVDQAENLEGEESPSDNETDENIQAAGATLADGEDEGQPNDDDDEKEKVDYPTERQEQGLGIHAADGQDVCQDTGVDEKEEEEGEQGTGDTEEQMGVGGETAVEREPSGQGGSGTGQSGQEGSQEEGEGSGADQTLNEVPNPFNNPGDATKYWHKKLNMVESKTPEDQPDAGESSAEQGTGEESSRGEYEYVPDEQAGTSQVLGEVGEDEAVELEQQEKADADAETGDRKKESQQEEEKSKYSKPETRKCRNQQSQKSGQEEHPQVDENETLAEPEQDQVDEEAQDDHSHINTESDSEEMLSQDEVEAQGNRVVSDLSFLEIKEEPHVGKQMDFSLVEDEQVTGISSEEASEARQRWARIQGDTHNLALRLCEKLRLVMEPLVASKLRGDYRTGKRINMKRVIGYIASGYRKDKIWLRRTKPAKRNYRVLLAVDDSESMLKSGTGEMALRAMATLALGMSQLEIGELGVASFGDDMRLLHPFNQPFTSESGIDVVRNFKFDQTRTRTALCIQSALSVLEMPGDVAPLQLMFMISDGRIERDSRLTLRKFMRDMMERNVLLAMIIVEPKDDDGKSKKTDSIVNMKEVSFEKGRPIVKRFIEDYPFPYYMILDDMQALPEVLGDALRQWFEMLAQMQEKR